MSEQPIQRRLAAILAADVVGYTRLMEQDSQGTVVAWSAARDDVIEPIIADHSGRTVKLTGDGFLAEFPTVEDAVRCAIGMQDALLSSALDFRMGVSLGDIIDDGRDIHGEGVNIAARIESLANSGGINISGSVYEQVRNRIDVTYDDLGEKEVKNVSAPVRVYAIRLDGVPINTEKPDKSEVALADKPSIAVLPFDNMSGDPEQEYFADGITEDIITEISKIDALFVISRNSTFTYKGKSAKAQDICNDLSVQYLVEGSVRKVGNRVRITAQLIDGQSGGHLWAERYDRDLVDIFALQDDITEQIVRALEVNLVDTTVGRQTRAETETPEAYDCFLRGREQYRLHSKDSISFARELFERAIELDPNYAAAYAGLAETYFNDFFLGSTTALDQASELAQTARDLDQSIPLVYEALSSIQLFRKQHDDALETAKRWLEIEPSNADAYANLAVMQYFSGNAEPNIALIKKAMRLNPYYPFYYILYEGQTYLALRRFEEAVNVIKRSVVRNPESIHAHLYLAACHGHLGQDALGQAELAEVRRIDPDFSLEWLRTYLPYKRAADLDLLVDGLKMAGLTEE